MVRLEFKNMEKPTDCRKCPLMGEDGNHKYPYFMRPMMCCAIWVTKREIRHCIGGKILEDCPLVETIDSEVIG